MEKSIETIWKEGFLNKDALVVPKINDLYNQKSQHVIEKFRRLAKANLIGLVIGAGVILCCAVLVGVPIIGLIMAMALLSLVVIGVQQSKVLNQINTNQTSYQYLHAFNQWLQGTIDIYERVYKFIYPLLFALAILGAFYGDMNGDGSIFDHLQEKSELTMIFGVPLVVLVPLALMVLLSSVFSKKIYQLDIDLMYGRVLGKIKELLGDMEELMAG